MTCNYWISILQLLWWYSRVTHGWNIDALISTNVTCWLLSTGTAQITLLYKCLHCVDCMDVAATTHVMFSINSSASIQSWYPSLQRDGHNGLTVGTACLHRITHHPCCKCNVLHTLNIQRCGKYGRTIYLLMKHCAATTWQLLPHYLTVSHLYKWAAYTWCNMSDQKSEYKRIGNKWNPGVPSIMKAQMCKTLSAMDSW